MTRRAARTRDERRAGIEEALLLAIEKRTADGSSFGEVTLDELASDAGISKSGFYMYFERKSDLLRIWFARFVLELEDAGSQWWTLSEGLPRADLAAALEGLFVRYREHAALLVAVHESASHEPAIRQDLADSFARTRDRLRKHIRDGQREGWINPALPPGETAVWLTCLLERGLSDVVAPTPPRSMPDVVDACTAILWRTLYAPAA